MKAFSRKALAFARAYLNFPGQIHVLLHRSIVLLRQPEAFPLKTAALLREKVKVFHNNGPKFSSFEPKLLSYGPEFYDPGGKLFNNSPEFCSRRSKLSNFGVPLLSFASTLYSDDAELLSAAILTPSDLVL